MAETNSTDGHDLYQPLEYQCYGAETGQRGCGSQRWGEKDLSEMACSLFARNVWGLNDDPMRQTSFWGDTMDWHFFPTKRSGQPRKSWLVETARAMWPGVREASGELEGFDSDLVFDPLVPEIRQASKLACDMHMF